MDIKSLDEAIKALRAELDRVKLAIQRIEVIAEAVVREQQPGKDSSGPEAQSTESVGEAD